MLKLPAIFSDHMILQRRKPVVIWGESDARKVTVTIQDARVVTYVQDGKWQLFLPPMEAGGPYVLTVKTDNDEVKTYEDVMFPKHTMNCFVSITHRRYPTCVMSFTSRKRKAAGSFAVRRMWDAGLQ